MVSLLVVGGRLRSDDFDEDESWTHWIQMMKMMACLPSMKSCPNGDRSADDADTDGTAYLIILTTMTMVMVY